VERLAVLDIVPSGEAWDRADARLALSFWPWSLLAQPSPLPERILEAAAEAVVDDAASNWDSPRSAFPDDVREVYTAALRSPEHAHAICEEYRAAASIDREHDADDFGRGRRIACPTLVLWAAGGALDNWYAEAGGPLGIWRRWAEDVQGDAVQGGHFFPEAHPAATADRLEQFFGA
jgi:haloacetate dehalogenase